MKIQKFVEIINNEISEYGLEFIYNPSDGFEFKSEFKYVTFFYDEIMNVFKYDLKVQGISSSRTSMKIIQEITVASQVIEILSKIIKDNLTHLCMGLE